MEDRITPGLYLEMTDRSPEDYAAARVGEVLSADGVLRATWWANTTPSRPDLPNKLEEFSLLGMYEVDEGFIAPATPGWVKDALSFRRYPRPGQGSLSGKATVGLLLVLISPRHAEGAQELRDWADFVHIRYIAEAAVPGFAMITPYENVGSGPQFMHLYEMSATDPEAAFRSMLPRVSARLGCGPGAEAYDRWASHPELRIVYVNTFHRLGERARG